MKTTIKKPVFMAFLIICGCFMLMSLTKKTIQQTTPWVAPKDADALVNPLKGDAKATEKGKTLYNQMCTACHGNQGKGDGAGGKTLKPKPTDHTSAKCQSQTDGALYWKMTEGKGAMAGYKAALKEAQRWQLVNYIRTLSATAKTTASK